MAKELKRVLLLEDVEANANLIRFSLEKISGFDVTSASSALEAIACFEAAAFDLCLFDHLMPGMTGLDAMRRIRAMPAGRDIPFVFLTARSDANNWRQLKANGAQAVIAKPFDIMLLGPQLLDIHHACQACDGAGDLDDAIVPEWADSPARSGLAEPSISRISPPR